MACTRPRVCVWGGGGFTIMRQERRPFGPIGWKIAGRVSVFQFVHGVICALPHLDIDALLAPREGGRQRRCASLLVSGAYATEKSPIRRARRRISATSSGRVTEAKKRARGAPACAVPSALKHKPSSYQEGDCHHHRPLVSGFVHFQCCWLHCC